MLPNEGCTRRRPSRFVAPEKPSFCARRALRGSRTGKKKGGLTRFIRPSIAPTAVENQSQHVHSAKLWRKFCSSRGAQGHAPASRPAARPGGQEKSVAMSWFYMAMQREPVVMWSCFIGALGTHPRAFPSSQRRCPYAVKSARGLPPIASLERWSRGARAPRRTARPSRRERIGCGVVSQRHEDPRS